MLNLTQKMSIKYQKNRQSSNGYFSRTDTHLPNINKKCVADFLLIKNSWSEHLGPVHESSVKLTDG